MKVLQYLWQTKGLSIIYGRVASGEATLSSYFVDSDHVMCLDSRRSVSCGVI